MKLFLDYESALEFWRAAGCGLAPIPEPSSIRSIDGKAVRCKQVVALAPQLKLVDRPPIYALVSRRKDLHKAKGIKLHLCGQDLPAGAFSRISDDVLVASPALCLLHAAQRAGAGRLLPLIELCMELLGGYSLCTGTRRGFRQHEPFLCRDDLQTFIESLPPNTRGSRLLAEAAGYALPQSWSPRETASSLMLTLPEELGGFAFPHPKLNAPAEIADEYRPFTDAHGFFLDLSWPGTNVVLEYDGDDHLDPERISEDKARRNLLATMGYRLIVLEKTHAADTRLFNQQIGQLAKLLGITLEPLPEKQADMRTSLRRYLFNPRHLELWAFAKPIQLLPEDESVDSAMEKH